MCILRGFRLPDGIVPIYPVFTMNLKQFMPSMLMMVDDEIISPGFTSFCSACIIRKGGDPALNPILSPLNAPDFLLRLLPQTQILVCEIDGLRDQGYSMALRMQKLGVKVHIHHLSDFVHGFCNMDTNGIGINEFRRATNTIISIFREMLQLPLPKQ